MNNDIIEPTEVPSFFRGRRVLFLGLLAWGIDLLIRHYVSGVASAKQGQDLLLHVGIICAVCGLVMFIWTRNWTVMKYGAMAILLSVGALLIRFLAQKGPQPVGEWERDTIQTGLETGGAALIIATVSWVVLREWRRVNGWRHR